MAGMEYFTKENISEQDLEWREWRKLGVTEAARVEGPFGVETTEGKMRCRDGWVAIDAKGNPYPIADEVLLASYEEVHFGEQEADESPQTIIMRLTSIWHEINTMQTIAGLTGESKREFALAKTAIEDAEMRFNRGYAHLTNRFKVADLQQES